MMIHGFRGTHHGLEKIVASLPEYSFIVPDLPGFGESPRMPEAHTIENYATLMMKFIDHYVPKDSILLGHSMGATILAAILAEQPTITSHAIMINPVSEPPTKGIDALKIFPGVAYHWIAGKFLPEKIGLRILQDKYLFLLGSATMTKTRDPELRKWIHWNHMTYMKQFSDRSSLFEAYQSSTNTVVGTYANDISTPLLLISGEKDTITSIKAARRLAAKMPNATLVEITDVGHIVHYEKPEEAAKAITAFLSRRQSSD